MDSLRSWILLFAAVLICSGCALKEVIPFKILQSEGEQALSAGVKSYEEGKYKEASGLLTEALRKGLSGKTDQVKAHKYLAFIYCVTGQKKKCTSEFRVAFKIDPKFDLQPAEAGHPIWGPVFRDVKASMTRSEY